MNLRVLSIVGFFITSMIIGSKLIPTQKLQAQPPVKPSIVEVPIFGKVQADKSVDEINVEIDLSTLEVSVKGTTDANVNVHTVGQPKPIVKWETKVVEKEVVKGYPYLARIGKVPTTEQPISPVKKLTIVGE